VKIELLKSSIGCNGESTNKQHLTCFVIDDRVAIDAGSLAQSCSEHQRTSVRDIVLTHAHLDHIAGLPLFIDDLFATLTAPIRIHACRGVIEALENHIFNWSVYPRFSELANSNGAVIEYRPLVDGVESQLGDLRLLPVPVNHKVTSSGFVISNTTASIGFTGDTSVMDEFWRVVNQTKNLSALLIECAFPDSLQELADVSHHLTPLRLKDEVRKFQHPGTPMFVINMKPMYRDEIVAELDRLRIPDLHILEPGAVYEF